MKNRHVISIALWVVGVLLLLLVGFVGSDWAIGALLLLAFGLGGVFFYRRGK